VSNSVVGGFSVTPSVLTYLNRIWTGATRGAIAVAAIVVMIVIVRDVTGDVLTIEPINLPRSLIKSGLTPAIVATRFQAQWAARERGAHTSMRGPGPGVSGSTNDAVSDIVVPGTGLSIGGLTRWIDARLLTPSIRSGLHLPPQRRIAASPAKSWNSPAANIAGICTPIAAPFY